MLSTLATVVFGLWKDPGMGGRTSDRGAKDRVRSRVRNVPAKVSSKESKRSGIAYARRCDVELWKSEVTDTERL